MTICAATDDAPPVRSFDLNADLGEGFGRWSFGTDADLLTLVTSANVACGFHAGDPSVMRRTLSVAAEHGVTIGAHVSYPDLLGFGRRVMEIPASELRDIVLYQLAALDGLARVEGIAMSYVKPHGALYNRVAADDEQAAAVVEAVVAFDPSLILLGLPGGRSVAHARAAGLATRHEAFVDRAYLPDGRLAPRAMPGSVLDDPEEIAARAVRMVVERRVEAIDGTEIEVRADSLCLHGDTATAVAVARRTRRALEDAGLEARSALRRDRAREADRP